MGEFEGYYAVLGLKWGATPAEIKRAYRSLARQWHPDRFSDPIEKTKAEAKIKQINLAYEKLKSYGPPAPSFTPPRAQSNPDKTPDKTPNKNPNKNPKAKSQKPPKPDPPETKGKNPYQLYQMASTQAKARQYEQAIDYLSRAIQLQPDFATAYRYRGWLRSMLQFNRSAAADLAKAKTLEQQQQSAQRKSAAQSAQYPTPPHADSWPIDRSITTEIGGITVLALRPSRHLLISANRTGRLNLWNLQTGRLQAEITAHTGKITGLALTPSGRTLISSGADGLIKIWRLRSDRLWQSAGLQLRQSIEAHRSAINAIVLSQRTLLTAGEDGLIQRWQIPSGKLLDRLNLHASAVQTLAIDPKTNWVASGDADGQLKLWQLSQPGSIRTLQNPTGEVVTATFQPQPIAAAPVIAWGDRLGWVYIAHLEGQILQTLPAHQGAITDLSFSPCGQWLATAGEDGQIRIWDPSNGKIVAAMSHGPMETRRSVSHPNRQPNQGNSRSLLFTPDSKKLITSGDELLIQIWQVPLQPF